MNQIKYHLKGLFALVTITMACAWWLMILGVFYVIPVWLVFKLVGII